MKKSFLFLMALLAGLSAWAIEQDNTPRSHEYVDLGLPSGTLWATTNVGATNPEDYGDYFAWGETTPKDVYNWSTYKWCNGSSTTLIKYCTNSSYGYNGFVDNKTELDPEDDAATANWGPEWRMPSSEQMQELYNNCTSEWTTRNGVSGYLFTSNINGASLFLPAAGDRWNGELYDAGSLGRCWTRTLDTSNPIGAYDLNFSSGGVYWTNDYRYYGRSVRAVRVPQEPEPEHEYVDLGLPSGTQWATTNVGATSPEDYGDYFAWGETTPKDVYDWSTYQWCNGSNNTLTKYCFDSSYGYNGFVDDKTELDPEDDAATANWGPEWRMPSSEQMQELKDNCTSEWTTRNGVSGYLFTSNINGASLFLPAAGDRWNGELYDEGSQGGYWTRTLDSSYSYFAYRLGFNSGSVNRDTNARYFGHNVRAVRYMTYYSITLPESFENGMVTCDKETAAEGETVTLTVTPDEGYELETLTIATVDANPADGAPMLAPRRANVDYTAGENGIYTFVMPAAPVTVNATFKETAVTGLVDINATAKSGQRYNLMGQPVGNDYKGIVIEDGKKILVK